MPTKLTLVAPGLWSLAASEWQVKIPDNMTVVINARMQGGLV